MIKGFLTGVLGVVVISSVYLCVHLGAFEPVDIDEEVRGPLYVLYSDHQGAYYQISEVISRVEGAAKLAGAACAKTFGEYFDDPSVVEEDRLRSRGGCIATEPFGKTPEGLHTDQIPDSRYVVAHFSGSPAIGPWKVYTKVHRYLLHHRLKAVEETIEIYSLHDNEITTEYLFPLK